MDGSAVGLAKAQKLAATRGVKIRTQVADLADFTPESGTYGAVVSIFAHLPGALRRRLYPLVTRSLRPGGLLLLEAYSPAQLSRHTGGPKDPDLLMSVAKLTTEFPDLEVILARETDRDVSEGRLHTGLASVVQFLARKAG